MKLITINPRTYQLERPGASTVELKITGSLKTRAEARIDENTYHFTPENFWQTTWLVYRDDKVVARLKLFSTIELLDERGSKVIKTYKLKQKSWFSSEYELLSTPGTRRIFETTTTSKWYSSRPVFDIKLFSSNSNAHELSELLIYCAFMRGMKQLQGSA